MNNKARQRMIDGINTVAKRNDCTEAVVLQQRGWLATIATAVAVFVALLALQSVLDLGTLIMGGLAGASIGIALTLITETYWLGYCDGEVLLVETNTWQTQATQLTGEYTYPVPTTIESALIMKKVNLAGVDYLMPRNLETRLRAITGS